MQDFLTEDELDPNSIIRLNEEAENAIEIEQGTFSWEHSAGPVLREINLAVRPGELIAVVGK